ncbi:MAG: ATP-binding protein [Muribaculaceae bacterium]|nr:ATP-binding protein [Muribaculaceae bacterium]
MKIPEGIDLTDVAALSRALMTRKVTRERFSLDMSHRDAANALYTALKVEVEQRGAHKNTELVLDNDTRQHILDIAEWLVRADFPPSLLLYGKVGNGKTSMARALMRLIEYVTECESYSRRIQARFVTAKDVCELCAVSERFKEQYDDYRRIFNERMLVIDELGSEPSEVIIYGQPKSPVTDLISHRYDRQLLTIITTNLKKDELKSHYGLRVYDRLKEMVQPVVYSNSSYR